jgi:hypothetical protein
LLAPFILDKLEALPKYNQMPCQSDFDTA